MAVAADTSHRARRYLQPEFQQQFIGDPFLTPQVDFRAPSCRSIRAVPAESAGVRVLTSIATEQKPARCQRINVSGCTTMRAERHAKQRERNARFARVAASIRRVSGGQDEARAALIWYPAEHMEAWRISTGVSTPENDDPSLLDPASEESPCGPSEKDPPKQRSSLQEKARTRRA